MPEDGRLVIDPEETRIKYGEANEMNQSMKIGMKGRESEAT